MSQSPVRTWQLVQALTVDTFHTLPCIRGFRKTPENFAGVITPSLTALPHVSTGERVKLISHQLSLILSKCLFGPALDTR